MKNRVNPEHEMQCLQGGVTEITYERDEYIYYIENTTSEISSKISGMFLSLGDAVDGIQNCYDWWGSNGTGSIYRVKPGVREHATLVWKN